MELLSRMIAKIRIKQKKPRVALGHSINHPSVNPLSNHPPITLPAGKKQPPSGWRGLNRDSQPSKSGVPGPWRQFGSWLVGCPHFRGLMGGSPDIRLEILNPRNHWLWWLDDLGGKHLTSSNLDCIKSTIMQGLCISSNEAYRGGSILMSSASN